MSMRKLAIELESIAYDVMASGRLERTKMELEQGLANWVRAFHLLQTYGNSQAQGNLRSDIEYTIINKDLDANTVWNVK